MRPLNYTLIIFDLDGTLAERDTNKILPGVADWFARYGREHYLALATNQGAVGLRYWMESGGFGDPAQLPTERQVWQHIHAVVNVLIPDGDDTMGMNIYVAFAYQSQKTGQWGPVPDFVVDHYGVSWSRDWRKPAPGMLLQAMADLGVGRYETLMVGDSEADRQAAAAAGVDFMYADDFFGRKQDSAIVRTKDSV